MSKVFCPLITTQWLWTHARLCRQTLGYASSEWRHRLSSVTIYGTLAVQNNVKYPSSPVVRTTSLLSGRKLRAYVARGSRLKRPSAAVHWASCDTRRCFLQSVLFIVTEASRFLNWKQNPFDLYYNQATGDGLAFLDKSCYEMTIAFLTWGGDNELSHLEETELKICICVTHIALVKVTFCHWNCFLQSTCCPPL